MEPEGVESGKTVNQRISDENEGVKPTVVAAEDFGKNAAGILKGKRLNKRVFKQQGRIIVIDKTIKQRRDVAYQRDADQNCNIPHISLF